MSAATLIFPHQLFDPHPALAKNRPVIFIEDSLIFGGDPHVGLQFHSQKLILHRASMKTYAAALEKRGYEVRYLDYAPGKTTCDHLQDLADEFHYCAPTDFLLSKRLARLTGAKHVTYDTPMFLSPPDWLEGQFAGNKKPFMARFYENQRKRMGILVDAEGNPEGGRFSFDDENRKSMPKKGLDVPPDPSSRSTAHTSEAKAYIAKTFPEAHGNAELFHYPVSHASAHTWLQNFFTQRFALFGPYEDAISHHQRVLFHSILTPMLNCGLLTPQQVIDDALAYAEENNVPLNSLEGFVRQIIGWREFMRGMYDKVGVASRNSNFFNFEDKPIPQAFYTATTGIAPIDTAIQRALDHSYCHHIERLMLLGNFMLLCGYHPTRVYNWFMELFIDAYDWVMVPNVYGMSQFADGGSFTTKPYISGSNYVKKMSDYRAGDWCPTWDGLFWSFIKQHEAFFKGQYRLAMMARQLDKMPPEKLKTHLDNAEHFLTKI